MMPAETTIAVPWGIIAVKTWGDSKNEAILCIHGLLDNAASFDRLIPLLPDCFFYICPDLPGHGFSSHFPASVPLHNEDFAVAIKLVVDHFNKKKYIMIGHSLGARLAALHCQLYPEEITKLVMLDSGFTLPLSPSNYISSLKDSFKMFSPDFKDKIPQKLSYKGIVEKIIDSRYIGQLTFQAAEDLAKRMIKKVGDDEYEFTHDKRNRYIINPPVSIPYLKESFDIRPVQSETLLVLYSETVELYKAAGWTEWLDLVKAHRANLIGDHASHHTTPQDLGPVLSNFLLKGKNKL